MLVAGWYLRVVVVAKLAVLEELVDVVVEFGDGGGDAAGSPLVLVCIAVGRRPL